MGLKCLDIRDPWEVLGLPPGSGPEDARTRYRELARKLHPDMHPGLDEAGRAAMSAKFAEVTSAFRMIEEGKATPRADRGMNFFEGINFVEAIFLLLIVSGAGLMYIAWHGLRRGIVAARRIWYNTRQGKTP